MGGGVGLEKSTDNLKNVKGVITTHPIDSKTRLQTLSKLENLND